MLVVFVLCGGAFFVSCAPEKTVPVGLPDAKLAAVVTVKSGASITVQIGFTNPSENLVIYGLTRGVGLYLLDGTLYREGEKILPNIPKGKLAPFDKEAVRELKPGQSVVLNYRLPYTNLDPGVYELRLIYEIPPKSSYVADFGFTPMKLEQTILLTVQAN